MDAPVSRERLDSLAQKIATLSLRIDAAKHQLLTYLREFDAHDGWAGTGALSTAAWLAWRIDIGQTAAREHVRVARALGQLPRLDEAFAAGQLSYAKVRAITRVATPESEQDFIEAAKHATASQMEKVTAAYRRTSTDPKEPPMSQRRYVRRCETPEGMVRIEVQLPPEQANVVWEALTAAVDAGRSDDSAKARREDDPDDSAEAQRTIEAQRQLDPITWQAELTDALVNVSQAYIDGSQPTLGSGYELVILTTHEQLEHGPTGIGGYLPDGTPVPQHVARMLACDCSRVDVDISESGEILNVGRARRTIPSAIGRALWLRDGGCRVPGCGRRRHLHAHHIHQWADGGETSSANLVLLCSAHHAAVHEKSLSVELSDGQIVFENAHGLRLQPAPVRDSNAAASQEWLRAAEREFETDAYPGWDGSRLDLDAVLSSIYAAEAWRSQHAHV
jgi:hypothetical protein